MAIGKLTEQKQSQVNPGVDVSLPKYLGATEVDVSGEPMQLVDRMASQLDRLHSCALDSQRFEPTLQFRDTLEQLAIKGKVERALLRRLSSQDAEAKLQ